ncbi:MAG: hypothetical protein JO001_06835 [Alphaproteobacteria bacterium]|nr:hypothetical protein [Alphaproteobacteria bacterium]
MRQSGNYGALHETHREVDEQLNGRAPASQESRYYGALHETQHEVDAQQNAIPETIPQRPEIQRSWTHHGGMVPQQGSANDWVRQNYEIRMSDNQRSDADRTGENTQPAHDQNDPELQEARAAVEEARRREAAERARTQERDRGGPER